VVEALSQLSLSTTFPFVHVIKESKRARPFSSPRRNQYKIQLQIPIHFLSQGSLTSDLRVVLVYGKFNLVHGRGMLSREGDEDEWDEMNRQAPFSTRHPAKGVLEMESNGLKARHGEATQADSRPPNFILIIMETKGF